MFVSASHFATSAALAIFALAASGCMELRQTLVIDRETSTADLTVRAGSPSESADGIGEPLSVGDLSGLQPYLVDSSSYSDGRFTGFDATYENVPLDVVRSATQTTSGTALNITVADDMTASMSWDLLGSGRDARPETTQTHEEGVAAGALDQDLPLDFYLAVTYPGARVLSSNATSVSGDTAVWEYTSMGELLQGPETFRVDWDVPGTDGGGTDWIVVIVGVLFVVGLLWFVTRGGPTSAQRSQSRLHAIDIPQLPGPTD